MLAEHETRVQSPARLFMKGSYALICHLGTKKRIKIGALGRFLFLPGCYVYVGSGLNNLNKRIERHLCKNKKLRWHIDYFFRPC